MIGLRRLTARDYMIVMSVYGVSVFYVIFVLLYMDSLGIYILLFGFLFVTLLAVLSSVIAAVIYKLAFTKAAGLVVLTGVVAYFLQTFYAILVTWLELEVFDGSRWSIVVPAIIIWGLINFVYIILPFIIARKHSTLNPS